METPILSAWVAYMSNWLTNPLVLGAVMVVAGVGIPVMAALNAGLGTRLGSPVTAATVLFSLAFLLTATLLVINPIPSKAQILMTPPHFFGGGLFVAFYVLAVTWIAPKIGVGDAIFLVLFGQLVASAFIDHFGWFGAPQSSMTTVRCVGMALMGIGIMMAKAGYSKY